MKRLHLIGLFALLVLIVQAQSVPVNYYTTADGKKGAALKTALYDIISKNVTVRTYTQVWTDFTTTDVRSDGYILDRYAPQTNYTPDSDQGSTGSAVGDGYNREHSMPKSWFNEASPMYTDLFHLIPSDCYTNTRRSNYPFGETAGTTYTNGYSKLGTSTLATYSGTVFEPYDEYKGDFARIYFYMVTRNENVVATWSSPMLAGNKYPALSSWALQMLLDWAENDPVSDLEIARNEAVYGIQGNRNPFVDYEGLEQHIWGDFSDQAVSLSSYTSPYQRTDATGNGGVEDVADTGPTVATNLYEAVTTAEQLDAAILDGKKFILVGHCTDDHATHDYTMTSTARTSGSGASAVHYYSGAAYAPNTDNYIDINCVSGVAVFSMAKNENGYTFNFDGTTNYLQGTAAKRISGTSAATAPTTGTAVWTIAFSSGTATITNTTADYGTLRCNYNSGTPRFTTYTSSPSDVIPLAQLYVQTTNGTSLPATPVFSTATGSSVDQGTTITITTATNGATIYYSTDGGTSYTAGTAGTATATVTLSETGTTTLMAYATLGGVNSATATATYTVTAATHQYFEKITSAEELETGVRYLIVCEGYSKALGGKSGNFRNGATVSIDNGVIDLNAAPLAYPVTLGGTSEAYTFALSGDSLLAMSGSNNTTLTTKLASAINNDARWTITFSSGNAVIQSLTTTSTTRAIRYNNSNTRFGYYAATGENAVQLYKETTPAVVAPAAPTISPSGGTYSTGNTATVTITADDGATIYYTTDGTTPTTSSTTYTAALSLTATTTLKAIAVKKGVSSSVTEATFTFNIPSSGEDEYERIYTTDDLVSGDDYLIVFNGTVNTGSVASPVNQEATRALGAWVSGSSRYAGAAVSVTDDDILDLDVATGTPTLCTITDRGDYYTISYNDNGTTRYIGYNGSGTNLSQSTSYSDTKFQWDISFANGIATIQNKKTPTRYLGYYYNGDGGYFKAYTKTDNEAGGYTVKLQVFAKRTAETSISRFRYGTYFDQRAWLVPDGLTALTLVANDAQRIAAGTTYTTGTTVPAATPVLLYGGDGVNTTNYTLTFRFAPSDKPAANTDVNLLRGSMSTVAASDLATTSGVSADDYRFYKLTTYQGADMGFYYGATDGAPFDITATHKCWLLLPRGGAEVRSFVLDFDMLTAIGEVTTETLGITSGTLRQPIYDLQGRRVEKPVTGRMYISGGRIVIAR